MIIQQADTAKTKNNRIREGILVFMSIPIVSFIIPIVFFGARFQKAPYFTWVMYITTMIITVAIWIGNRAIMLRARRVYPHFSESRKRLVVQSLVMLLYTLIVNNLIGYAKACRLSCIH